MIDQLKLKLCCETDQILAELLGVGRNTIARMKKGATTKITEACKVIDVLTDEMTARQLRKCRRKLHYGDNNNVSRSNTMFDKNSYERISDVLETSVELLFAIEQVTGDCFEYAEYEDEFGERTEKINENTDAYELWENGGRELEILAALPVADGGGQIEDGTEVFWGLEGKFAEFDGTEAEWVLTDAVYVLFNHFSGEIGTWDGEKPSAANAMTFGTEEAAAEHIKISHADQFHPVDVMSINRISCLVSNA